MSHAWWYFAETDVKHCRDPIFSLVIEINFNDRNTKNAHKYNTHALKRVMCWVFLQVQQVCAVLFSTDLQEKRGDCITPHAQFSVSNLHWTNYHKNDFEKNELLSIQFSKCHPPGKRPQVSLLPPEKQCAVYVILLLFVSLHLISKAKFQQAVVTENYDFSVCVLQTQIDVYYTHVYKKNLYKYL